MNAAAVADMANVSASLSQSTPSSQPGVAQVARFEQQLQLPQQFYQSPPADSGAMSGSWRVVVHSVASIDDQYRLDVASMESPDNDSSAAFDAHGRHDPQHTVEAFAQGMSKLTHMSFTMMNMSLVTTAERLAGENMRSLYQVA